MMLLAFCYRSTAGVFATRIILLLLVTFLKAAVVFRGCEAQDQKVRISRNCVNDDTFDEVDINLDRDDVRSFKGVSLTKIKCPSYLKGQNFQVPPSINWQFKAVPDDQKLQMFTSPPGFLRPSWGTPQLLEFEWGPQLQSSSPNQLKQAGVEVLVPQSQLTSLDVSPSGRGDVGDSILVNLTYSRIETFTAKLSGSNDKLWIAGASSLDAGVKGQNSNNATLPRVIFQESGSYNEVYVISLDTQITSSGFETKMEVLGTLAEDSTLTGSTETLLIEGDVSQDGVTLDGFNTTLIINPSGNTSVADPCEGVTVGESNSCETALGDFVDLESFNNFSCRSSNDLLQQESCSSLAYSSFRRWRRQRQKEEENGFFSKATLSLLLQFSLLPLLTMISTTILVFK